MNYLARHDEIRGILYIPLTFKTYITTFNAKFGQCNAQQQYTSNKRLIVIHRLIQIELMTYISYSLKSSNFRSQEF